MPAATPGRLALLCFSGIVALWLLGFFSAQAMDSIPTPFIIEIDGKPVAKVDDSAEDKTQATLGSDAAVFSLANSRLQYGDWILGRNTTENRSLLPKKVSWFKASTENEKQIQPVTAKKEGDSYSLTFTRGGLMAKDGSVFVDLLGDVQHNVKVILQQG